MAGGEGTRLRPLSSQSPKPMVPVVGTPVIEHNLRLLRDHGITEVVITLHHLGADIRNRLGDGSDLDMSIDYVIEERPLGTAGSVRNAAHLLDDTFLIVSGDCLTDIDLSWVITQHRERGTRARVGDDALPRGIAVHLRQNGGQIFHQLFPFLRRQSAYRRFDFLDRAHRASNVT